MYVKKKVVLACLSALAAYFSPLVFADTTAVDSTAAEPTAAENEHKPFEFGMQTTYIFQHKNDFQAPYTAGANNLSPNEERSYTFTTTMRLGAHLWQGGEFYINPEIYQAVAMSGLTGLGGPTNGELQKGSNSNGLDRYIARLFLRQTWNLGGSDVQLDPSLTQFAETAKSQRIVATAGTMAITDIFDTGNDVGDPRGNFMNWSFMTYGAYDYAANLRGYTSGIALEYYNDDWAVRYGRYLEPSISNGSVMDHRIFKYFGEQMELEHDHKMGDLPGFVKLLFYRNVADMGVYQTSIDTARAAGTTPDIATSRGRHAKLGMGIHIEQNITPDLSLFTRLSANNGKYEEWAFAEIDRQAEFGLMGKGTAWNRAEDSYGVAYANNSLSRQHAQYLANGGTGAFLGDGYLDRHSEDLIEAYYNVSLGHHSQLTLDYQNIENPGYNGLRKGPVNIFGARFHFAYF